MSVKIKLTRIGKKDYPFFRIVVSEERSKRNGKIISQIGYYDPKSKTDKIKFDNQKLDYWLSRGAQPTKSVRINDN